MGLLGGLRAWAARIRISICYVVLELSYRQGRLPINRGQNLVFCSSCWKVLTVYQWCDALLSDLLEVSYRHLNLNHPAVEAAAADLVAAERALLNVLSRSAAHAVLSLSGQGPRPRGLQEPALAWRPDFEAGATCPA